MSTENLFESLLIAGLVVGSAYFLYLRFKKTFAKKNGTGCGHCGCSSENTSKPKQP